MEIEGIYTGTFKFRDEKTGYSGFNIKCQDDTGNESFIFCKGKIQKLTEYMPLKLEGEYTSDNCGRISFSFKKYSFESANINNEILFLNNLNIEGLTQAKASDIIHFFGGKLFDVIEDCKKFSVFKTRLPDEYLDLGQKIFSKIYKALKLRETYFEIAKIGGDYTNATLLIEKFGINAIDKLKIDPYKYGHAIGLAFKSCELLAYKTSKITYLSKIRAVGIMLYTLDEIEYNGNTYATINEFKAACARLQNKSLLGLTSPDYILACAILSKDVVVSNNKIYKKRTKILEEVLANNINRVQRTSRPLGLDEVLISELEQNNNVILSESQKKAMKALASSGIKVITGGPGSGKTTLTNIIIQYCEKKYPDRGIVLCAPTGCAAQNMSTKTSHVAETIHKTLGIKPFGKEDVRVTIKREEKIYIIDEASMADLEISKLLFESIPNDSIVILVGDVDQLPSVQAGSVLQDIIEAGFETYRLEGSFRQAKNSAIIENAYKIKEGNTNLNVNGNDFSIWDVPTDSDAIDICLSLSNNDNCQVLCPTKKHDIGSKEISSLIQSHKNLKGGPTKRYGTTIYHIDDKIIMTHNNYASNYYNGEIGYITDIDDEGIEVKFLNHDYVYIKNTDLIDMNLAYALTVHKSQGAEYEHVIIFLPKKANNMMNRNLLYTAVTRAKQTISIISVENSLEKAITNKAIKRNSGLVDMISSTY